MARAISHRRRVHRRSVRALTLPQRTAVRYGPRVALRTLTRSPSPSRVVGRYSPLLPVWGFPDAPTGVAPALPSLVHVLPDTHEFSQGRFKRERVLSGEALAKAPVRPTVNLKALYYARPDVMVCVRRKQRREVLAAKGRLGGKHRPPRRTPQSDIICY